jgi:integrase/recombinase XerD
MQTTKRATGLRTAAPDYETLVQQAINKVTGFEQLYKELERAINVTGKSTSTLTNYSRHLAHLALHYDILPTELDNEQVLDYLHLVKANGSPSATFFKFTVYGMRYACRLRGLPYEHFSLPSIERNDKLPVVLNASEVRALMKACDLLKHRLLIGLCYGCGLRCAEVRQLRVADVDTERGMVHVHQGKGNKDRCLPMGAMLQRGIRSYIDAEKPRQFLFEGKDGNAFSEGSTMGYFTGSKKSRYYKGGNPSYTSPYLCYPST